MTTFQRQGVFLNSKEGPIETPQPTQECPRWLAILSYLRGGDWQKHESAHFPFFFKQDYSLHQLAFATLLATYSIIYYTHTLFICVFSSFHFFWRERRHTLLADSVCTQHGLATKCVIGWPQEISFGTFLGWNHLGFIAFCFALHWLQKNSSSADWNRVASPAVTRLYVCTQHWSHRVH